MIVTDSSAVSVRRAGTGTELHTRGLARRGMLHSETESVDYLRLPAGARLDPPGAPGRGREGAEAAWLVIAGSGWLLDDRGDDDAPLRPGDVVLTPAGHPAGLRAADTALEVVWIAVLPTSVSKVLPARRPVV